MEKMGELLLSQLREPPPRSKAHQQYLEPYDQPPPPTSKLHGHRPPAHSSARVREGMMAVLTAATGTAASPGAPPLDGRQLLECYVRLLSAGPSGAGDSRSSEDATLLHCLHHVGSWSGSAAEVQETLEALHRRIDEADVARCRSCSRFLAPGVEYDVPAAEWAERSTRWVLVWEQLQQLWSATLDAAVAAMSAQAKAATPQYEIVVQLLAALVRLLPSLRELALTSEADNLRWQQLCFGRMPREEPSRAVARPMSPEGHPASPTRAQARLAAAVGDRTPIRPAHGFVSHSEWIPDAPFVSHADYPASDAHAAADVASPQGASAYESSPSMHDEGSDAESAVPTWLAQLARLQEAARTQPDGTLPRTVIVLQLRQIELGLRSVPDLSQTTSLFVNTGRALVGALVSLPCLTVDADLASRLRDLGATAWEALQQRDYVRVYEPLASITEASAIIRAALQIDTAAPAARNLQSAVPALLGALHRLYFGETTSSEQRWEARAAFALLLGDILLPDARGIDALPEPLIRVACFGDEPGSTANLAASGGSSGSSSGSSSSPLSPLGAIEGLLKHGDDQVSVEPPTAAIRLLRWGCAACEGQLASWVHRGFGILVDSLASSSSTLEAALSDELSPLAAMLRKSGLGDTGDGVHAMGLISQALQAPIASFLGTAGGEEPWEALAATLLGAAEHLDGALTRAFHRAEQSTESAQPLLRRTHEMLTSLAESGKRVYNRERRLTLDISSLVLDCVNGYRFEQHPSRIQFDSNRFVDNGVPTILLPQQCPATAEGGAPHRLGAPAYRHESIADAFPVVEADGSVPLMDCFVELIAGYNKGHERGQACWRDLEPRVLEQMQNALLNLNDHPGDQHIALNEHGAMREDPGAWNRFIRIDAGPRWIAMRLEVLESALNYLQSRIEEDCSGSSRGGAADASQGGDSPVAPAADVYRSLASPREPMPRAPRSTDYLGRGASMRMRSLHGLCGAPRSVEFAPDHPHEAWVAPPSPVSAGRKGTRVLDATIDAYRRATLEAMNGHLWETCVYRFEEDQLEEWREHFTWLDEQQSQGRHDLQASQKTRILEIYDQLPGQDRANKLEEEEAAQKEEIRALLQEQQATTALEVAAWTEHQAQGRHEATILLVRLVKRHCSHIRWQMSQLRPALARWAVLALLPPAQEIQPTGSDETARRTLHLAFMRGASQLTLEQWAELARYARPLEGLRDLNEYASTTRDANVVVGAVRAFMRTNGYHVDADLGHSTLARWRQGLHSHVWEMLEVVAFDLKATPLEGQDLSHEHALGPETATLFWRRRQPLHRALEGAAARVSYCLDRHGLAAECQSAAAAAHEVLGRQRTATQEAFELCRQEVVRSKQPLDSERRLALVEQLTALSASFIVVQEALLLATKSPAPMFSKAEVSSSGETNNNNHQVVRRPGTVALLDSCAESLKQSIGLSQTVFDAYLSVSSHSFEDLAETLAATRAELASSFHASLVSESATDFVLRRMPVAVDGSKQDANAGFAQLLEADHDLKERMNRWLADVNSNTVAGMRESVERYVGQMRISTASSTASADTLQKWADSTRSMLETVLPPSVIPVDLRALWLKPKPADAHVREAALLSALRVCHALSLAEDRDESGELRAHRQRLDGAIEQRWLLERDVSILALLKTSLDVEALGLLPVRRPTTRRPISAPLPPSTQSTPVKRLSPNVQQRTRMGATTQPDMDGAHPAPSMSTGKGVWSQFRDMTMDIFGRIDGLRGSFSRLADAEDVRTAPTRPAAASPPRRSAHAEQDPHDTQALVARAQELMSRPVDLATRASNALSATPSYSASEHGYDDDFHSDEYDGHAQGGVNKDPLLLGVYDDDDDDDDEKTEKLRLKLQKIDWLEEPYEPPLPHNVYGKFQRGQISVQEMRTMVDQQRDPFPRLRATRTLQRYARGFLVRRKARFLKKIRDDVRISLNDAEAEQEDLHKQQQMDLDERLSHLRARIQELQEQPEALLAEPDVAQAVVDPIAAEVADIQQRLAAAQAASLAPPPRQFVPPLQLPVGFRDSSPLVSTGFVGPPGASIPPSPPPSPPAYPPSVTSTPFGAGSMNGQVPSVPAVGLLMSAMKQLEALTVFCQKEKADLESSDAHLLDLRKRSLEVQRMREWILADPKHILHGARTIGDAAPSIDRESVLLRLRQYNSTSIPEVDLRELAATLMTGAQTISAKHLSTRLATESAQAKDVAERRDRSFHRTDGQRLSYAGSDIDEGVKSEFTTHHHMEALHLVASMQVQLGTVCAHILKALHLKTQLLNAPDSMLSYYTPKGEEARLERRDIRAFADQIEERLRAVQLTELQKVVREWEDLLHGYVSARRGGGFRISSESVWQSSLRRRKQQTQQDKVRERLLTASRMAQQRDFDDSQSDVHSTALSADGQDALTKHSKFFAMSEAPLLMERLPEDCTLELGIEYCTARRPSRNGSLRGNSKAYVEHCVKLKALVELMMGDDSSKLRFVVNEPELSNFKARDSRQGMVPGSVWQVTLAAAGALRPSSADLIRGNAAFTPRLGSFEVSILLRASDEKQLQAFGPFQIFSKLEEGRWPYHDTLAQHFRTRVQMLIAEHRQQSTPTRASLANGETDPDDPEGEPAINRRTSWQPAWEVLNELAIVTAPADHHFVARFEYCNATRPSANGWLRGNSQTYFDHCQHMRQLVEAIIPSATILVNTDAPATTVGKRRDDAPGQRPKSEGFSLSLPNPISHAVSVQAAKDRLLQVKEKSWKDQKIAGWKAGGGRGILDGPHKGMPARLLSPSSKSSLREGPFKPRIGSLEVSILLLGPTSNARYGPKVVFSKLQSKHWPQHDKFISDFHVSAMECIAAAGKPGGSLYRAQPSTPETPKAPMPMAAKPLAPEPLAPEPLAPEPLAPKPLAPEPLAPESKNVEAVALYAMKPEAVPEALTEAAPEVAPEAAPAAASPRSPRMSPRRAQFLDPPVQSEVYIDSPIPETEALTFHSRLSPRSARRSAAVAAPAISPVASPWGGTEGRY